MNPGLDIPEALVPYATTWKTLPIVAVFPKVLIVTSR